jgi:hypothetical protein
MHARTAGLWEIDDQPRVINLKLRHAKVSLCDIDLCDPDLDDPTEMQKRFIIFLECVQAQVRDYHIRASVIHVKAKF